MAAEGAAGLPPSNGHRRVAAIARWEYVSCTTLVPGEAVSWPTQFHFYGALLIDVELTIAARVTEREHDVDPGVQFWGLYCGLGVLMRVH